MPSGSRQVRVKSAFKWIIGNHGDVVNVRLLPNVFKNYTDILTNQIQQFCEPNAAHRTRVWTSWEFEDDFFPQ